MSAPRAFKDMRRRRPVRAVSILLGLLGIAIAPAGAQHNAGRDCRLCHGGFKAAGTVFRDFSAGQAAAGIQIIFTDAAGRDSSIITDANGNFRSAVPADGAYLVRVGAVTGRTWHELPLQAGCNACHIAGGNGSPERTKLLPPLHTRLPIDNDCRTCHHFPASQAYGRLRTPGVLNAASADPAPPASRVDILGRIFEFDPAEYEIRSCRPDVFAPGYYSMFDVIMAVARKNGVRMSARFDPSCMTHFIRTIDGRSADYWYRFSYDAGSGNAAELNNRRALRWDEVLWRPGVWIKVTTGEALEEIKAEYREEIARERVQGHVVPEVRISINPSLYQGNPVGSGRVTVGRSFTNVRVTAHDWRGEETPAPYSRPFRAGVTTSLDILLSLRDQGALDLVTGAFYTRFAGHYIDSHYVVALGFPDVGQAHASGRQGFVYTTENGTPSRLPNNAASTHHILSDIHVIHAPDFSQWRWAELGNPYYESRDPGSAALLAASVEEDFRALGRGFNLYPPEGDDRVRFNIFEPGPYEIILRGADGRIVARLWDARIEHLGARELPLPKTAIGKAAAVVMAGVRGTQARPFPNR